MSNVLDLKCPSCSSNRVWTDYSIKHSGGTWRDEDGWLHVEFYDIEDEGFDTNEEGDVYLYCKACDHVWYEPNPIEPSPPPPLSDERIREICSHIVRDNNDLKTKEDYQNLAKEILSYGDKFEVKEDENQTKP